MARYTLCAVNSPDRAVMRFDTFLDRLSEHLGEHQLPIRPGWKRAVQIVADDAVHYDLMKEVIAGIYRANRCSKPSDPVALVAVLDSLGDIQQRVLEKARADAEAMALLHEIGEVSLRLLQTAESHYADDRRGARRIDLTAKGLTTA